MHFGDVLRGLIEDSDLTQKYVSGQLDIPASTLNNYVNNTREPDFETLKRIAVYFNVSIDYLLSHYPKQGTAHAKADLLRAFRQMPPAQQKIFLAQGKAAAKACGVKKT